MSHPTTAEYVVGIDVGGTGIRGALALVGRDGPVVERTAATDHANFVNSGGIDLDNLTAGVARVLSRVLPDATPRVSAVALGCTGLSQQGERVQAEMPSWLARATGADVVVLSSDALTCYLGGLGWRPGAVVSVGTGAVAVGADMRGRWRRVDGWGYSVGDAGGGSWIGRRGLDAGLRAYDGRSGGSPVLLDRLIERYGSPVSLAGQLARRDDRAALLAAFAADVVAAADEDARAADILDDAGGQLADSVVAALMPGGRVVCGVGALITSSAGLSRRFEEHVKRLAPDVEVVPPAGTNCDGAVALAARALRDGLPPGAETLGAWLSVRA